MSYEITIESVPHKYANEDPVFMSLRRCNGITYYIVLERPDALELSAAHDMRMALEKLARLGNEPHLGNSEGNMIARAALAKAEGKE